MQNIVTDSSGNTITMKYDSATDTVTINNATLDSTYYIVDYNQSTEVLPLKVVNIESEHGWEDFTDFETKTALIEFFETNKINK